MEEFDIGRFIPLILIALYFLLQFFSSSRKPNKKVPQKEKSQSLLGQLLEDLQKNMEPPAPVKTEEVPHWTLPEEAAARGRSRFDSRPVGSIDESKSFFKEAAFQDHDFFETGDSFATRRPQTTIEPSVVENQSSRRPLALLLADNDRAREAVLLSEILSKPRSLRRR